MFPLFTDSSLLKSREEPSNRVALHNVVVQPVAEQSTVDPAKVSNMQHINCSFSSKHRFDNTDQEGEEGALASSGFHGCDD
jgi:hypothetical protein